MLNFVLWLISCFFIVFWISHFELCVFLAKILAFIKIFVRIGSLQMLVLFCVRSSVG